jgi:integrase
MASTRLRNDRHTGLYRDHDGKQRSAGTYATKREALAAARLKEAGITVVGPAQKATNGKTLRDYAPGWLKAHSIEPRTREVYRSALRKNVLPYLGDKQLGKITTKDVTLWLRKLEKPPNTSPWVVRQARTVLSALFGTAIEEELATINPAHGVRIVRPPQKLMNIVTPENFARLMEEIPEEFRLLVLTAIETGARWGELIELRPGDLEGTTIKFTRVVQELDGPVFYVKPYPKNRKHRSVQITGELAGDLAESVNDDNLFFSLDGGYIPGNYFRIHVWQPAFKRAGISPVKFKNLRDAHASWLLAGGADLVIVRDRLGHSDISVTSKYLGTLPDAGDKALDAFRAVRFRKAG